MADSSAQFKFEDEQWQKFLKKLNKKWQLIEKRIEFGRIITSTVYQDIIEHFEEERGPYGAWAQWSKIYSDHMDKIGRGGNKKLQFTGRLRMSITPEKWRPVSDGVLFYNNATLKSGFPYAYAHDTGGPKLPQRRFMWLSNKGLMGIIDKTEKWIVEDL